MRFAICNLVLRRRSSVLAMALTIVFACAPVFAQEVGDKMRILSQLSQASAAEVPTAAAEFARKYHRETAEVALDLIVHRGMTGKMPDVRNLDLVIGSLVRVLKDPFLDWAHGGRALPPADDPRTALLSELRREYATASDRANSWPVNAVEGLTRVVGICQKLRCDVSEAHVLSELGDHYFHDMQRYRDARTCYGRAADILSPYEQSDAAAQVNSSYGALSRETGSLTEAVDHYVTAAQLWGSLTTKYPTRHDYSRLAGLAYMEAGRARLTYGEDDPTRALELMGKAIEKLNDYALATRAYRDLIERRFEVAAVQRAMSEFGKALSSLEAARRACNAAGDVLLTARLYDEFAATYTAGGKPTLAAAAQLKRAQALNWAATQGAADLIKLAKTPQPSGKARDALLASVEQGAAACKELKQYPRAAEMWQKLAPIYKKSGATSRLIACLRSLANTLDALNRPQDALQARLEAVTTARAAKDNALAAKIGSEMVKVLVEIGDLQNAKETFMDLADIFRAAGDRRGAASVLEARGELLANNRQFADAISDFEGARAMYIDEIDDPWAHGVVSLKLATAYRAINKPADALRTLQAALKEIESRFDSENLDPNADDGRAEPVMNLYREITVAYVKAGNEKAAADLLDEGLRYRWIARLVRELRGSDDPAVAKFALGIDIVNGGGNTNDPASVPNRPLVQTWGKYILECSQLWERHRASYNALPIDPISFYGSRNSLPKDAAVIAYLPTAFSTYVFVCGPDKPIIRQLDLRLRDIEKPVSDLRRAVRQFEGSLSAGIPIPKITDWREQAFLEMREPLWALYQLLLKPIEEDIKGKRLLVFALPDDLAGVPMHALVSSEPTERPRFLIGDHEVSYIAKGMLKDLVSTNSRAIDPAADRVAIFADPDGSLPGAREEAAAIRKVYTNSESYVGTNANRANFGLEATQASVIHIAAHHWIDPNPAGFAIQLARDSGSDGRIGVDELTELMTTRVGMVVLSACDSVSSSDPISTGAARAAAVFSLAGARSVLGGLWKVSDDASAKIMVDFYRGLAKGLTRTEALRRALLNVVEFNGSGEFAHPFFWACFALYGNPR